jgi:hypothetical protein
MHVLVGRPEGKTTRKTRRRREDNIKMNIREKEWAVVDWIHLAHDRDKCRAFANTIMKLLAFKKGCAVWSSLRAVDLQHKTVCRVLFEKSQVRIACRQGTCVFTFWYVRSVNPDAPNVLTQYPPPSLLFCFSNNNLRNAFGMRVNF